MSARAIHVAGIKLLVRLKQDPLAIAKAFHSMDVVALHGAAEIAWTGPDPKLAATDPALFKALRDGGTLFFLKGYAVLNREILREAALARLTGVPHDILQAHERVRTKKAVTSKDPQRDCDTSRNEGQAPA